MPREIPCGGFLCENCITELLEDRDVLDCPECGLEHSCPEGIRNFPTASIFDNIRNAADETSNIENCKEHGTEASIYCQEPFCRKAVHSRRRDEVADGVQVQKEPQNQEANGVLEEGEIEDDEDESIISQRESTMAQNQETNGVLEEGKNDGTVAESEQADTKKYIKHEEQDEVQQLKPKHSGTTKLNFKGTVTRLCILNVCSEFFLY